MSLVTQSGYYEWKIKNGANTYSVDNLISGDLCEAIYEKIGIGNVASKTLNLTLWNVELDPTQPIILSVDAVQADGTRANYPKGIFYIDTIAASPYSEYVEVTAFDAILKAEVPYMKSGDWVETTDKAVVEQIASDIGVAVSADTLTLLATPMTINEVPSIGDNGTTSRQMLSVVAIMRGGNFIINDDNELELVPLKGKYEAIKVVTIDSLGIYQYEPWGTLGNDDDVVTLDGGGLYQNTPFASLTDSTIVVYLDADGLYQQDTWENIQALVPPLPDTIVIGDEVVEFDVSPTETIKRVELWASGTTSYRSPSGLTEEDWDALGGIVLSASMPIMASQELADALFAAYEDFTYVPHTARTAYVDPEVRLGTPLQIKDDTVLLTNRTLSVDVLSPSDLSADPTEQQKSYYPYMSPIERAIHEETVKNSARITITDSGIEAEIIRATGAEKDLGVNIKETADSITQTFTDYKTNQEKYIRYSAAGIELGEQNSNFKAKLSNTELAFTGSDGQKAAWVSNTQLNIQEAVIQQGGSQKLNGSTGHWVWQVANDELQLKWVYD